MIRLMVLCIHIYIYLFVIYFIFSIYLHVYLLVLNVGNEGTIHFIVIGDDPSNPQQPIQQPCVKRTTKRNCDHALKPSATLSSSHSAVSENPRLFVTGRAKKTG